MDNRQYPESADEIFEGDSVIGHVGHIFGQKDGGWDVQVVGGNGGETQDHLIVVGEPVVDKDTNRHTHYRTVTKAYADQKKEQDEQKKVEEAEAAARPKVESESASAPTGEAAGESTSDQPTQSSEPPASGGSAFESAFSGGQS